MNRRIGVFLSIIVTLCASAPAFAEDEASVARLQSRGMQVVREGQTVVAVKGFGARDGDLKDVKQFPMLRELELTNSQLTDAGLAELKELTTLEEIQLYASPNIKGDGLKYITGNTKLKTLRVDYEQVDDSGLRALRKAGLLHTLSLFFDGNERPERDDQIASLNLGGGVTDAGLAELVGLPALRKLGLSGHVTDQSMPVLAKITKLRDLEMRGATISDAGLREIAGLKDLEVLMIDSSPLTDDGLKVIAGFKSLHVLYLNSPRIKGEGFRHLAGLPLQVLFLCGGITDNYLRVLRDAGLMHTLYHARNIYRLPAGSTDDIFSLDLSYQPITSEGLKEIKDLPGLRVLSLNGTGIKVEEFVKLSGVPKLEVVQFDANSVTDEGLRTLARHDLIHLLAREARGPNQSLKTVSVMDLSSQPIGDDALKTLRNVTSLTELLLNGTSVGDAGVGELKEMPALATLELRNTRVTNKGVALLLENKTLQRISLSPHQIDDETLILFQKHDRLPVLSITRCKFGEPPSMANIVGFVLNDTQVTDAGLKLLSAFPQLTFVNIRHSHVTEAGVTELLKTFPKLRVLR